MRKWPTAITPAPPPHVLYELACTRHQRARGWKPAWRVLRRRAAEEVLTHNVYRTPLGVDIVQTLAAPGIVGHVPQSTFVPNFADYVEFRAQWVMGQDPHPEATYLLYPFRLSGAQARDDLGGQAVLPDVDQLPGVCRDYFTTQNWVDFNDGRLGRDHCHAGEPDGAVRQLPLWRQPVRFPPGTCDLLGWVTNT